MPGGQAGLLDQPESCPALGMAGGRISTINCWGLGPVRSSLAAISNMLAPQSDEPKHFSWLKLKLAVWPWDGHLPGVISVSLSTNSS